MIGRPGEQPGDQEQDRHHHYVEKDDEEERQGDRRWINYVPPGTRLRVRQDGVEKNHEDDDGRTDIVEEVSS